MEHFVKEYRLIKNTAFSYIIGAIVFALLGIGVYIFFAFVDPDFSVYISGFPVNKEVVAVFLMIVSLIAIVAFFEVQRATPKRILLFGDRIEFDKKEFMFQDMREFMQDIQASGYIRFLNKGKVNKICLKGYSINDRQAIVDYLFQKIEKKS